MKNDLLLPPPCRKPPRSLARALRRTVLGGLIAVAPGCIVVPIGDLLKGPTLEEVVVEEGEGFFAKQKIALIDVSGTIIDTEPPSPLGPFTGTVSEIKAQMERAERDPEVRAVVLRISSPGGEVTACDIVYEEVRRLREEKGIPVVASVMDVGASGGYYVACAADRIVAHPTAIVGSIGVLLQGIDLSGLLQKIGVAVEPVKSSEMKDLGSIFRPRSPQEEAILQELVNDMYGRFVAIVAESRPGLGSEEVLEVADGRVLSGVDAAEARLVDRTGYLEDAIEEAARLGGVDSPTVVRYTRKSASGANIYTQWGRPPSARASSSLELDLRWGPDTASSTRLYYLWVP